MPPTRTSPDQKSKLDFLLAPGPPGPAAPAAPLAAPGLYDTRAQSTDSLQTTGSERQAFSALSLRERPDLRLPALDAEWDDRRRPDRVLSADTISARPLGPPLTAPGLPGHPLAPPLAQHRMAGSGSGSAVDPQRAYSYDSAMQGGGPPLSGREFGDRFTGYRTYEYKTYAPARPNGFQPRQESGFSDVTPSERAGSGGSVASLPAGGGGGGGGGGHAMPLVGPASAGSRSRGGFKTDAEMRDKREQRRMKNRISAARSRQRKTDTFETLQRELGEAKNVIETLTLQLDRARLSDRGGGGGGGMAVPHDLRSFVGRDYVSVDEIMDVLRMYVRRAGG